VGRRRKLDCDGVSGPHVAASLADQIAVVVVVEDGGHQPLLEMVELDARVPKSGDLHDPLLSKPETTARRQREQSSPWIRCT
jgi:hypothetical protein